jgi:hypothetical protein
MLSEGERAQAQAIANAFRGRAGGFTGCYEAALRKYPSLEVTMKLRWTIEGDGSVSKVCSVTDTAGLPASFLGCLSSEIGSMRIPLQPEQPIQVIYPLAFKQH